MNEVQERYAIAKAAYEALRCVETEHEVAFCAKHGLVTDDGKPAKRLFMLSDDTFDCACKQFCRENKSLSDSINAAHRKLEAAEDALIDFGLSIMSSTYTSARSKLKYAVHHDHAARKKMIDLIFRLDTGSMPKNEHVAR